MLPKRSPVFEAFVSPAYQRDELWRLVAGTLLAIALWIAFLVPVAGAAMFALYLWSPDLLLRALDTLQDQNTPGSVVFFLLTFLGFAAGLAVALHLLHKRAFTSLFGPSRRILWRHYFTGLVIVGFLAAATGLPAALLDPPTVNLPVTTWLAWLPVAIVLLVIQTGTEELFFRGYLLQQFAARFQSRWLWWVLPSALFGAMHFNPATFGPNAWLVVVSATFMGLILADVTARSGNISLAMGMHLANNFTAVTLIGLPGQLSGLSLYHSTLDLADVATVRSGLLTQIALLAGLYAIYIFFFARRVPEDPAEQHDDVGVFD